MSIAAAGGSGFVGPSINDFFPPTVLFAGTPFALNRVMLIRLFVVVVMLLLLWLGTRRMKVVPSKPQMMIEFIFGFVRKNVILDTLGEEDGRRYMSVLMTMFFVTLGMNVTGVIPGLQLAGTSVIGLPLIMAIISYVLFVYAGVRKSGWRFFKNALFMPGVPWPLYFLLTPIELFSTFILRPVTLTLRLLMNMVSGHMLLVLCYSATQFFFFTELASGKLLGVLGIGSFAFGVIFVVFELFVEALQAYVFTFLAAIYIQQSVTEEH